MVVGRGWVDGCGRSGGGGGSLLVGCGQLLPTFGTAAATNTFRVGAGGESIHGGGVCPITSLHFGLISGLISVN